MSSDFLKADNGSLPLLENPSVDKAPHWFSALRHTLLTVQTIHLLYTEVLQLLPLSVMLSTFL